MCGLLNMDELVELRLLLIWQCDLDTGAVSACRCYSCAYRVGWSGDNGRYNCDYLFWDNLYRACDFHYPNDFLNRGSCKTTADSMYLAVRAGGGSAFNNNDACPGESWKLPNAQFCFNPVYQLGSVVSNVRPGNGQQWGAWTNYAQVGALFG
jgi:hypothetical protein